MESVQVCFEPDTCPARGLFYDLAGPILFFVGFFTSKQLLFRHSNWTNKPKETHLGGYQPCIDGSLSQCMRHMCKGTIDQRPGPAPQYLITVMQILMPLLG